MKRFRSCLILISTILLALSVHAQQNGGGLLYANTFAQWSIPQGNQGSFSWSPSSACIANSQGASFQPFKVGTAVILHDQQNPALNETLTPSTVNYSGSNCSIAVNPIHTHYGFTLTSATFGLQEAINYALSQGGTATVVVTPAWSNMGGITSMISSAQGSSAVSIWDERTGVCGNWFWNGSAYVLQSCAGGAPPNPPVFSVQGANNSLTGFTSDSFIQINTALHEQAEKLPQVNLLHTDFGASSSCANVADPTGVLDSTCAIQAAFTFAQTHPTVTGSIPVVYAPEGTYKVSAQFRFIGQKFGLIGDGPMATIFSMAAGSQGFIFVQSIGATTTSTPTIRMEHFSVTGQGVTSTGNMIEIGNATQQVLINDVQLSNANGIGLLLWGDSERNNYLNIKFNGLRLSYFMQGSSTNENTIGFYDIAGPGETNDNTNTCYQNAGPLCVGGAYPAASGGVCANYPSWPTLTGSAATYVPQGTVICDGTNIEVATTAGTTGTSAPSPWNPTARGTTNDPASGNVGQSDGTGPVQWTNAANYTLVPPSHWPAAVINGNNNIILRGSTKPLNYTSGILNLGVATLFIDPYLEGFSGNSGQPRTNFGWGNGAYDGGTFASKLASGISGNLSPIPVQSTTLLGPFSTTADVTTYPTSYSVYITPCDYLKGNTSASSCTAGALRNSVEVVTVSGSDTGNNIYPTARCAAGSTAICTSPTGFSWPSSAIVHFPTLEQMGPIMTIDIPHDAASSNAGGTGYFPLCSDQIYYMNADGRQMNMTCGDAVGPLPDGVMFNAFDSGLGNGLLGSAFSFRGFTTVRSPRYSANNNPYINANQIDIPLAGQYEDDFQCGTGGTAVPNGLTGGNGIRNCLPFVVYPVHGASVATAAYARTPSGSQGYTSAGADELTTFATATGSPTTVGINHHIKSQECWMDEPALTTGSSTTAANILDCLIGGPSFASAPNRSISFLNSGGGYTQAFAVTPTGPSSNVLGGVGMGPSANFVQNSLAIGSGSSPGTGWSISIGGPTISFTTGQTDPYGGTNATLVTVGAPGANWFYQDAASSSFTGGQNGTACVWAYSSTPNTPFAFDLSDGGNVTPNKAVTLTSGWVRYSYTGVINGPSGTTKAFRFGNPSTTGAVSFYIYNPQVQTGSSCGPDLPTTTSVFTAHPALSSFYLMDSTGSTGTSGQQLQSQGSSGTKWTTPTLSTGTPTVGQAACIKSAGPPVVIGYCSTVVSSGGACTCN